MLLYHFSRQLFYRVQYSLLHTTVTQCKQPANTFIFTDQIIIVRFAHLDLINIKQTTHFRVGAGWRKLIRVRERDALNLMCVV